MEKLSEIITQDFKLPRFISVSLLDNHPAVQHIRERYAFEAEKRFIHITGFQASRTESCIGISLRLNFGGGSDVLTDEVYFLDIVDQRISPRIQGTSSFADPSKDPILRALLDHLTSGPGWAELNPEGFSIREPRAS